MRRSRSVIGVAGLLLLLDLGAAKAQPPGAGNHHSQNCRKGQSHCSNGTGGSKSSTTTTTTSGPLYRAPTTTSTTTTTSSSTSGTPL